MQSTIYFYGGAGSVTGSNFLLDTGEVKIAVDCGLFQGKHSFENTNWDPFPYNPAEVSVLINTHAHIDHIGRIPKLVKDGFRGPIISTEATRALAEPLLLDAMELAARTAERLGKEPLYTEKDIAQAMRQWKGIPYHQLEDVGGGVTLELFDAGHILGSAIAVLSRKAQPDSSKVAFTGDLGGGNSPLLAKTEVPGDIAHLVVESVYGDRVRQEDAHRRDILENHIENVAAKGGTLLIPAFSTERTQDLLFEIRSLFLEKRVPSMPVYLDSPLAQKITAAYLAHPQYFSDEMQKRIAGGEHIFDFPELQFVEGAAESENMRNKPGPKIILAGSGMSNGGRVVAHEAALLPDEHSTLLIVGYQSAGSLGRKLIEGAKKVEIRGEEVAVRCTVAAMYGYSAHMDSEQLLEFVNSVANPPQGGGVLEQAFVVMGEPAASGFLVQRVRDYLGVKATAPEAGDSAIINF